VVLHLIGDGEHVIVVDRDVAREGQPGIIVIGKRDIVPRRELVAFRDLPLRVGARRLLLRARIGDPAELRKIGMLRSHGREQLDFRTSGIGRLVIVAQAQIIEAPPRQIDGAAESWRVDAGAFGRQLEGGVARQIVGGRRRTRAGLGGARARLDSARARLDGAGASAACLGLLLLRDLLLARLLLRDLWLADEILPAEDHGHRQHDGDKQIALV
jgi:hypothetical protein